MKPRINTDMIRHAAGHACFTDEIAGTLRHAADILDDLAKPLLNFGEPVCQLCGESPVDNNLLRAELLEQARRTPPPTDQLDVVELQAALARANQLIASRNARIDQLVTQLAAREAA